jgi:hypothetical protein
MQPHIGDCRLPMQPHIGDCRLPMQPHIGDCRLPMQPHIGDPIACSLALCLLSSPEPEALVQNAIGCRRRRRPAYIGKGH